ncbi:hypothetical protein [Paracoccus aerodenitrificans]|uniref:hypothetical protein n=1 Tax=Paracoccus aerodenitrificans TaxID=3017781 RepID=UPI0022EFDAAD|nr:hypothetical protein [Paracoccus aerodenitrificans]WBU64019.1 hypothetical protein PAE61_17085 [Paracoccus aerodenitrificans]
MMRFLALFLLLAAPAAAQSVGECGEWSSARNVPEPWDANTASYAEGAVRIVLLDTLEPAAAALHLMILSPPRNELGERQCRVVSLAGDAGWPTGFAALDFAERQVDYDPETGLSFVFPVSAFDPDTGHESPAELSVTLNQSTGMITAEIIGS